MIRSSSAWLSSLGAPMAERPCPCGSGKPSRELYDARRLYCGRVCDACVKEKKAQYRPEIFRDPNYVVNEPIEPDDY